MIRCYQFFMVMACALFWLCSDLRNPEAVFDFTFCRAPECHPSSPLNQYPPSSGEHTRHLNARENNCNLCHDNYRSKPLHKNGVVNGYFIIFFYRSDNPDALWDGDYKTCNNISCHTHLPDVVWYTDISSLPCSNCHISGATYYPMSNGEHREHRRYDCEECHYDYIGDLNHWNGVLNSSGMINFRQGGTWNDSNGTCSSIHCHESEEWYDD
jgi:hypothetical protein